MSVVGKANGKIILMGEHAVVYGHPAIAMPFSAVEIIAQVTAQGEALTVACDFYKGLVHKMPKSGKASSMPSVSRSIVSERRQTQLFISRLVPPFLPSVAWAPVQPWQLQ